MAVSPDGRHIAYNCREGNAVSICVRSLDSLAVRQVAEGRDAVEWFFSPDGEWLAIADRIGLSKVSIHGGRPQPIARWSAEDRASSAFSWGRDGYILFGGGAGIRRVAASGGKTEPVTHIAPDSKIFGHFESWILPDGGSALITIGHADGDTAGLVNLGDGTVRDLGIRGYGFVYLPQGWLAFKQGTTVFAVAFDPRDPTRLGTPVPVIENVGGRLRVARDGSLVYIPTRGESRARLVWVDRDGRPTRVEAQRLDYTHLALAPDGRHALLNLPFEIDLIDLQQGTRKPLVGGQFPIWSSKGDRATFTGPSGLEWAPADGSGKPETLVPHAGMIVATSWNAATGDLAYYDHRAFEIWIRSPDGKTRRFLGPPGRKRSGRFSPDGKWIAFVSDETCSGSSAASSHSRC